MMKLLHMVLTHMVATMGNTHITQDHTPVHVVRKVDYIAVVTDDTKRAPSDDMEKRKHEGLGLV